ncbi:hypothetical protein [Senimuribacter intestinalis]|uniref:hypothetical protein n=1 Tax=Senimuribacter intestinalis TaxID=2941507 RepID=UPI00203BF2FE|nr:hypothetical protein [Senimuribacter intestinalis]
MSISVKNVASKANPNGKHLWKKYEKGYAVVKPVELISRSPVVVKLEVIGDTKAVTLDRLDGFQFGIHANTGMIHMFAVLSGKIAEDCVNGGMSGCTYDAGAQTLTLHAFSITDETGVLSEYTPKTIDVKELIGYAVSDNETQYPESGLHTDGVWYESYTPLMPFGATNIEIQEKTFASPKAVKELGDVRHNLNKVPRAVFVMCLERTEMLYPYSAMFSYCVIGPNQGDVNKLDSYRSTRYMYNGDMNNVVLGPFKCYKDKVEFSGGSIGSENVVFQAGVKYAFVFVA